MQKSLLYCRVSSIRQSSEGHGLDSQEHRCREYASQKGYIVEKVFRDSFTGGGDFMKRPAMSEMLGYMDEKPYNNYVIIFDDLKRLARDTEYYLKLKTAIKVRKASVECPNFVFTDSPEGKYVETIMAATGELEREQNRRQVMQKMRARLEQGHYCLPSLAVGYKYKKNLSNLSVATPQPEAKIVKEALEGFASGRFQEQVDVQRFLLLNSINNSKPVYLEFVKRILSNSLFYAGFLEFLPWEVSMRKSDHEPIIDFSIHEIIQQRLKEKTTTFVKNLLNPDFPLRGFVLCSCCKQPMTASWSTGRNGRFPYYRCKTNGCDERNKSIARKNIDKEFVAILDNIKPSKQVLELTKAIVSDLWKKKELGVASRARRTEGEIRTLQDERNKLLERISRTTEDRMVAIYETRISELMEKELVLKNSVKSVNQHRPNIETALEIVFDFLRNPLKQWETGDIHRKKLVLKLVFEQKLTYNRKSGFETAILSLPLRVFTLPEAQKGSLVEMPGIEPGCNRYVSNDSTAVESF